MYNTYIITRYYLLGKSFTNYIGTYINICGFNEIMPK